MTSAREEVLFKLADNLLLAHQTLFAHRHPQDTPDMHWRLIEDFHSPHPRIATQAFRGAAKSSIGEEGIVIAACRYLDAAATAIDLPLGLGSRHIAAAHISSATRAVGIVVSESAVVRLFCHGSLIGEVIPELWMLKRYNIQAGGPLIKETAGDLAVITPRRSIRRTTK